MYHECRHIMPSGARCKSPALRESAFCYYHVNLRRTITPKTKVDHMFAQLPSLEDSHGIQLALMEVLTALASTRIDAKRAGLLLYGIQIAAQVNRHVSQLKKKKPVRSVELDDEGNDLAPEKIRCEPPHDCPTCPKRDYCDHWEEWKQDILDTECKPCVERCQSCPARNECSDCVGREESADKEIADQAGSFSTLLPELTGCAADQDAPSGSQNDFVNPNALAKSATDSVILSGARLGPRRAMARWGKRSEGSAFAFLLPAAPSAGCPPFMTRLLRQSGNHKPLLRRGHPERPQGVEEPASAFRRHHHEWVFPIHNAILDGRTEGIGERERQNLSILTVTRTEAGVA